MREDFAATFLPWLRDATNERWRTQMPALVEDGFVAGTRWRGGLTAAQIEDAERRFGLRFPPDYRQFLALLHTPDPAAVETVFIGSSRVTRSRRLFPDWTGDPDPIWDALRWPLEGLLWSIEADEGWHGAWGPRPTSPEKRRERVTELVEAGPQLVPVFGHRYLVGPAGRVGNPVLSIHGADVIVYGHDLGDYLRRELGLFSQELPQAPPDDVDLGIWADAIAGLDAGA